MTTNAFGGSWTSEKLAVLQDYLSFYTKALQAQPSAEKPFRLVYIDAFAGTGRCRVKSPTGLKRDVPGSAAIALAILPPFEAYHFVEPKRKHLAELRNLVATHPLRDRITIHEGTIEKALPSILGGHDWRSHRGVLFLDPFGLQCSWRHLEQIQRLSGFPCGFLHCHV